MEVGFSSKDITPRPGIRLGGYGHRFGRPSTYVLDPLRVGVLDIVDRRGEELVLLQADLLGIYREDADVLRDVVSRKTGARPEAVMVATTHTHSAPETVIPMWRNTFPYSELERKIYEEWFDRLVSSVEEASEEAALAREGAEVVRINAVRVEKICYNRAFQDSAVDDELGLVYIESRGRRVVIASYACHPVTNTGMGISSDYPGVVRDILRRYGVDLIFLTGAAGNVDPVSKGVRYMNYMGRVLAHEILRGIAWGETIYDTTISYEALEEEFALRRPVGSLEETLRSYLTLLSQYSNLEELYTDPGWMDLLYLDEEIDLHRDPREKVKTIFQGARIGPATILGIPGELFSETSIEVKERVSRELPTARIIVSGYTNDYIGYIPTERAFREKKYEARLAKWSRVKEDAEPRVREIMIAITRELNKAAKPTVSP